MNIFSSILIDISSINYWLIDISLIDLKNTNRPVKQLFCRSKVVWKEIIQNKILASTHGVIFLLQIIF